MMLSSVHRFEIGNTKTIPADAGTAKPASVDNGAVELMRLVSVYQSNEYLFAELKSADLDLVQAQTYLETPGSNLALAAAHLLRIKARRSAVLTLLRANRHQARILLARSEIEVA